MTTAERGLAEKLQAELTAATVAGTDTAARQGRLGIIAKMLLAYPIANASQESGKARGEAYTDALEDIPAWAIAEAVRRWNRGEAGDHDYRWAPAPAVLRSVCRDVLKPLLAARDDLATLLGALPSDRAFDPTPIEPTISVPKLRAV